MELKAEAHATTCVTSSGDLAVTDARKGRTGKQLDTLAQKKKMIPADLGSLIQSGNRRGLQDDTVGLVYASLTFVAFCGALYCLYELLRQLCKSSCCAFFHDSLELPVTGVTTHGRDMEDSESEREARRSWRQMYGENADHPNDIILLPEESEQIAEQQANHTSQLWSQRGVQQNARVGRETVQIKTLRSRMLSEEEMNQLFSPHSGLPSVDAQLRVSRNNQSEILIAVIPGDEAEFQPIREKRQ